MNVLEELEHRGVVFGSVGRSGGIRRNGRASVDDEIPSSLREMAFGVLKPGCRRSAVGLRPRLLAFAAVLRTCADPVAFRRYGVRFSRPTGGEQFCFRVAGSSIILVDFRRMRRPVKEIGGSFTIAVRVPALLCPPEAWNRTRALSQAAGAQQVVTGGTGSLPQMSASVDLDLSGWVVDCKRPAMRSPPTTTSTPKSWPIASERSLGRGLPAVETGAEFSPV